MNPGNAGEVEAAPPWPIENHAAFLRFKQIRTNPCRWRSSMGMTRCTCEWKNSPDDSFHVTFFLRTLRTNTPKSTITGICAATPASSAAATAVHSGDSKGAVLFHD